MLNKVQLIGLYVDQRLSTTDISKQFDIPLSKVRKMIIDNGIELRSRAEGIRAASHKLGIHMIGKTFKVSDETKAKISFSRLHSLKTKGTRISSKGYVEYTTGENKGRSVHVVEMEMHIGRKLEKNEHVHHKNEIKTDNSMNNLQLMTINEHMAYHAKKNNINRSRDNNGRYSC